MTDRAAGVALRIGLVVQVPAHTPADRVLEMLTETASAAEDAGVDLLIFPDSFAQDERSARQWTGLQGPLLAMAVLPVTRHLGVVTALQQRAYHPMHASVALSTLSTFAPGRCGVLVQPDATAGGGLLPVPAPQVAVADRAVDHLAAVRSLWVAGPGEPYSYEGPAFTMRGLATGSPRQVDLEVGVDATGPAGAVIAERTGDWALVAADDDAGLDERFAEVARRGQVAAVELAVVPTSDGHRKGDQAVGARAEGRLEMVGLTRTSAPVLAGTPTMVVTELSALARRGCGMALLHAFGEDGAVPWGFLGEVLEGLGAAGVRRHGAEAGVGR